MEQLLELLTYPFVQRAVIGGILVALLTSMIGILIVLRRSSMTGDAIAHASLAGVALGLLLNIHPLVTAAIVTIIIALLLPYVERSARIPIDSLLGFILPFFMALGVLMLSVLPGYQPELLSFLFGSILTIGWGDIVLIGAISIAALLSLILFKEQLIAVAFDEEYAEISGVRVNRLNIVYGLLLALTIVVGIQLVGIVLLNALLVIPASTVRLFARSLDQIFTLTPILSIIITASGILLSIPLNLPTGPTIAATAGMFFLGALVIHRFK